MRAFLLCVLMVGATTIVWAQDHATAPAPANPEPAPTLSRSAIEKLSNGPAEWQNLQILAEAAALPDRALAAPAAEVASELAHTIDVFDVDEQEIPRAKMQALQIQWLQIAAKQGRWVDIRVYALDVASRLHALQKQHGEPVSGALWRAFLEDPDPQMRAAALALVPDAKGLRNLATDLLISNTSEEVSLAAGQRLCGPLRIGATDLPTLSDTALTRLQALASNRDLSITGRSHLAPCLVAEGSLESRRALGLLLQKSPPALRRHLNELVRTPQPQPQPEPQP